MKQAGSLPRLFSFWLFLGFSGFDRSHASALVGKPWTLRRPFGETPERLDPVPTLERGNHRISTVFGWFQDSSPLFGKTRNGRAPGKPCRRERCSCMPRRIRPDRYGI